MYIIVHLNHNLQRDIILIYKKVSFFIAIFHLNIQLQLMIRTLIYS